MGDIALAHLGDLGHNLTDQEFEQLEDVDVLFVPVGGGSVLSAKTAVELISSVQPRIVIPCHFKMPDLKAPLDPVDKFLREFGAGKLEPQSKVKITKKDLPQEETEVILMMRD
jgi:L-ascorbate metabolism protein UlaG (beta-lactamase superfamily)